MKIKNRYIKNLILPAVLIVGMFTSVFAETAVGYEPITTHTFGQSAAITSGVTKASGYNFAVETKDSELVMKSDAVWYWRADIDEQTAAGINKAENAHGIKVYTSFASWALITETYSVETDPSSGHLGEYYYENSGKQYVGTNPIVHYTHASAGGNTLFPKNIGGLDTVGLINYRRESRNQDRRNDSTFLVDENVLPLLGSNPTIKVKWYAVADTEDPNAVASPDSVDAMLAYKGNNGVSLKSGLPEGTTFELNKWYESTLTLDGQWQTKFNEGHFYFYNPNLNKTGAFIHSIELYSNETPAIVPQNSYTMEISEEGIRKNNCVEFDMTLPSDGRIASSCTQDEAADKGICGTNGIYNTKENSVMYASILDDLSAQGAALKYVMAADGKFDVYFEDEATPIAEGLALGTKYTYAIDFNIDEGVLNIEIKDGDTVKGAKTTTTNGCNTKYIKFTFDANSGSVMAKVDEIRISGKDSPLYTQCVEDADGVTIEPLKTENFALPTDATHSSISWEVKDGGEYCSINAEGNLAIITCAVNDGEVTLSATFTNKTNPAFSFSKDITFTVKGLTGLKTEASFTSSIEGGNVTATAVVRYPKVTGATEVTFAAFAVDPETGEIKGKDKATKTPASDYDVLTFSLNFAANGGSKVEYYLWDQSGKPIENEAPVIRDFEALSMARGAVLIWNGYDDFGAIESYDIYRNGVKIDTVSQDKIATEVAASNLTRVNSKYVDETAEAGVTYNYAIAPTDSNNLVGKKLEKDEDGNPLEAQKLPFTYYLVFDGTTETAINGNGHGIAIKMASEDAREHYTEIGLLSGADRPSRYIRNYKKDADSNGSHMREHMLNLLTTQFVQEDNINTPVAVRFTIYALNECTVKSHYNELAGPGESQSSSTLYYNNGTPQMVISNQDDDPNNDTHKWITYDARFENPAFGVNPEGRFSNGHFGLSTTSGENDPGIYVHKVEMIELEMYDIVG